VIKKEPSPETQISNKDHFYRDMTIFYDEHYPSFKLLTKRLKRIDQLEGTLLIYFGEEKSKMNLSMMFSLFSNFIMLYERSEANLRESKERAAKKQQSTFFRTNQPEDGKQIDVNLTNELENEKVVEDGQLFQQQWNQQQQTNQQNKNNQNEE
jgi:hypothetical protein